MEFDRPLKGTAKTSADQPYEELDICKTKSDKQLRDLLLKNS